MEKSSKSRQEKKVWYLFLHVFNCYCQSLISWRETCVQGYVSTWIEFFLVLPKILSLKLFGNSWGNSCTKFAILDIKFRFSPSTYALQTTSWFSMVGLEQFVSPMIWKITLSRDWSMRITLSIYSVLIRRPAKIVNKAAVFNASCFKLSESFRPRLFSQDNTLLTSNVLVYLGCGGLSWKIPFINRDTNQC